MRFPERELKDHCEYVKAKDLVVGRVYFRVHFLDAERMVPELLPRVFVGRNLFPADEGGKSFLYFRECEGSSPPFPDGRVPAVEPGVELEETSEESPALECEEESEESGVVEFDEAIDQLLVCFMHRRAAQIHE